MNNSKIYATGNENISGDYNISYYVLEKNEKFLNWLDKLVKEVLDNKNRKNKDVYVKIIKKEIKK